MSKKPKPAPGPWKIVDAFRVGAGQFIEDANGAMVIETCSDEHYLAATLPNARLIAAAPELKAACKAALAQAPGWRESLSAAIAKAEGREVPEPVSTTEEA